MIDLTKEQRDRIAEILRPLGYSVIKTSDFHGLYERHEVLLALENYIGGRIVREVTYQ